MNIGQFWPQLVLASHTCLLASVKRSPGLGRGVGHPSPFHFHNWLYVPQAPQCLPAVAPKLHNVLAATFIGFSLLAFASPPPRCHFLHNLFNENHTQSSCTTLTCYKSIPLSKCDEWKTVCGDFGCKYGSVCVLLKVIYCTCTGTCVLVKV